jgi:hypothetical protein
MIQVFLSAFVLYFLIEKIAGDDSPVKSKRVFGIVAVAFALQIGLGLLSKNLLWQVFSLCAPGLVVWLALDLWCRLGRAVSLKIAALYTAANFALAIIVAVAFYKLTRS